MNQFHDSMDRAAQDFLKEIFGKDYEYNVTDGDMDEGWLHAEIVGSGDYEVYAVQVEYTKMSGYTFLTHYRIECSFPDVKGYDEVCGYDEPTETGDVASDFQEEVSDECRDLFGGKGGASDFDANYDIEFDELGDDHIIIDVSIGLDEEATSSHHHLAGINEALKKLKEMIDSYKKKTTKKDS